MLNLETVFIVHRVDETIADMTGDCLWIAGILSCRRNLSQQTRKIVEVSSWLDLILLILIIAPFFIAPFRK